MGNKCNLSISALSGERIKDRLAAAIDTVVAEGRYILGPQVGAFEEQLAAYVGTKHAIACANGTDALLMPLMAYGIGPGDAVFCPSFHLRGDGRSRGARGCGAGLRGNRRRHL